MKRRLTLLLLGIVLSIGTTFAECYFTTLEGDTLRIEPSLLDNGKKIHFCSYFDGRLDYWSLTMTYPNGLIPTLAEMDTLGLIPYFDQSGTAMTLLPLLSLPSGFSILQSSINTPAYWDPEDDGIYDSYGTVKWEAGYHEHMFYIDFDVKPYFRSGNIGISGILSSTHDWRSGTIGNGVYFYRSIFVKVGYMRGDVDGNRELGIGDLTNLLGYLNDPVAQPLDEFQLEAADVNGDGEIGIADVTVLLTLLLEGGVINSVDNPEYF